jgi:aminoglycoside 3-N-acetyltransferase
MPIGHERLRAALDRVTGGGTDILLIHSSLSSCGHFTAGPGNVLSGFAACSNTLCLPTHTYCYPASQAEAGSLFDAATTPSQNGRLTELFRVQIGVTRSIHATHSLAASGPLAQEICANHYRCDSPSGAGTPYSRLVELHASVLMFGVSFHYYTLFHTAEFLSGSEHAFEQGTLDRLRIIDEGGQQRECWSRRQSRAPMRFAEAGELLERAGLARSETLGRSALLFVPDSSKVHDFLLERLKKTPDFLRQSCPVDLR